MRQESARRLFDFGRWTAALVGALALLVGGHALAQEAGDDLFESRIRPVLVESCFRCHGGQETENGLRVDTREALLKGGERGPAIVPGDPEASLLVRAIARTHEEVQMPPDQELPAEVAVDFARWVAAGAPWPQSLGDTAFQAPHWAFQPVQPVEPLEDERGWSDHPIDRFIAAKWREKGLQPVEVADPRTLLRRVSFDLVGLPPTPEEADAFLADSAPAAFERLVERLLTSPHYGERWGRHWMDVVRYADTAGDNADYPVPEARLYRDYIIDSFNADKPFDQFVREQVAGDLLAQEGPPERYAEQVVATGFLALSRRYATAPYELFHLTLEDTIDTLGQAFLGLSLKCARCHDHKFDPVTSRDYYALYGIFAGTQFPWAGGEELESKKLPRQHFVPLVPDTEASPLLADFQARLAALAGAEQINLARPGLPVSLAGAYAVRDGTPQDVAIQLQGDPAKPGPVVPRGAIAAFSPEPLEIPANESGRRRLAEWLTRPDHPLVARVLVNRVWQQHFGRGIVATPSNFGLRGAAPTHPELLDYLAARFVASGWSVKSLHKLILTSKTWQLASTDNAASAATDTGNEYYWRHDRRRLEAEAIRDAMLAASGRLDLNRPGPHPFPAMPDWHWTQHNPFRDIYPTPHRSVYLMTQRLQRHPLLALFDGPDTNTTTAGRTSSTVPPQSLYLLNSPEIGEIATSLADRLWTAAPDGRGRIDLAHRYCYARPATEAELSVGETYLAAFQREVAVSGTAAEPEREAWTSYARILLAANEFVYLD